MNASYTGFNSAIFTNVSTTFPITKDIPQEINIVLNVVNVVQKATATYDVQDKMQFTMAAVIVQILPNGNMVIQGREEVRLVNELREIEIKGIIRREDISSNNTVSSQKIANLRISYGGRGDLSDAQSAPWGQQYLNKLLPF